MWDMDTPVDKEYNSVDDLIYLMEKNKKDIHQLDLLLTHHRTVLSAKKTEDKNKPVEKELTAPETQAQKTKVEKIIEYENKFNLNSYTYPFNIFNEIDRSLAERIKTHIDKAGVDKNKLELFKQENPDDEFLQALKFPNLKFVLSSYGGSAHAMFTICGAFEYAKKQGFIIEILATGAIMSAALPIFSCGSKGYRLTEPGTSFLIHNISSCAWGTLPDIRNQMCYVNEMEKRLVKLITSHSTMTESQVMEILKTNIDFYFWEDDAVRYGIADKIV